MKASSLLSAVRISFRVMVDRAGGRHPLVVLGHPAAVAERGLAAVAAAGIDFVELDHRIIRPALRGPYRARAVSNLASPCHRLARR